MKCCLWSLVLVFSFILADVVPAKDAVAKNDGVLISHDVYFTLNDRSDVAVEPFAKATIVLMQQAKGVVGWRVSMCDPDGVSDSHDQDYDICLHGLFTDRAALHRYEKSAQHLAYIELHKSLWKPVRVYDSRVIGMSHKKNITSV